MAPLFSREALGAAFRPAAQATLPQVAAQPEAAPKTLPKINAAVSGADALDCPAHLLAAMPAAVTLLCEQGGRQFAITTSRSDYEDSKASRRIVFVGGELEAMALAAAQGRAYPATFADWLERKATDPGWRLTLPDALGECVIRDAAEPWTIGQLFGWLGVTLLAVQMEG